LRTEADKIAVRERYLAVDTANVADVLDTLDLPHQGLSPAFSPYAGGRLAGWAYTIAGQMAPYEATGDPKKMEACGGISTAEVSVWGGGGTGVYYFGELIALGMMERGSTGAVLDGGIRDSRWLDEHGFPVRATYRTPVQSIGRWRVTEWQVPVYLPGATSRWVAVRPGDFVLADEDGVIVVPDEVTDDVLAQAEQMTATEVQIRGALKEGKSLAECLEQFGHV